MDKTTRQKVFEKYGGKCSYCGCDLPERWHVDHGESIGRESAYVNGKYVFTGVVRRPENDHFDNYMPACASCNITKKDWSVSEFKNYIQQTVESLNRSHNAAYKFAKRFGLVQETPKDVKFWFEIYNTQTKNS